MNVRSLAASVALSITWPVGAWSASEAREVFRTISPALLSAWAARTHTPAQQLQKTVDHAVVAGIRRGWPIPLDVLYALLLGPVGASVDFLRGRPVARGAVGPGQGGLECAGGLIPDLDCCWGGDFREDANWAIGAMLHRLRQPYARLPRMPQSRSIQIACNADGVSFGPKYFRMPALSGARRNFRLTAGSAILQKNGAHFAYVAEGQRLMLRVLDEGTAQVVMAEPRGGTVGGRQLDLVAGDIASLQFTADSIVEAWACTCGTWECDRRHRLSGWIPDSDPDETLSTFIWNAVKGANAGFNLKTFITGMYYALLCDGY